MFATIIGVSMFLSIGVGCFWLAENISDYMRNENDVVEEEIISI